MTNYVCMWSYNLKWSSCLETLQKTVPTVCGNWFALLSNTVCPNDRFFRNISRQFYLLPQFLPQICWEEITEEFFSHFVLSRCLDWVLNHGLTSNTPIHYLLHYCDVIQKLYLKYFTKLNKEDQLNDLKTCRYSSNTVILRFTSPWLTLIRFTSSNFLFPLNSIKSSTSSSFGTNCNINRGMTINAYNFYNSLLKTYHFVVWAIWNSIYVACF